MVGREEDIEQPFVDDGLSVTSFVPYPSNRPFINSDYVLKKPPSKAFPESNRDAILDALKKMQSKLKKIEQDSVHSNTNVYPAFSINNTEAKNSEAFCSPSPDQVLANSSSNPDSYHFVLDRPTSCCLNYHLKNIEQIGEKTLTTENRVNELEKQLEKMKKILDQVKDEPECQSKKKGKLNPNDLSVCDSLVIRPKRSKTKSPERTHMVRSKSVHTQQRSNSQKVEIPFVVGKSISPSHNLGINIQNIRSLFKICSPKRFQTVNSSEGSCQVRHRSRSNGNKNIHYERNLSENEFDFEIEKNNSSVEIVSLDTQYSNDSSTSTSQIDFDELLCILQEDYTKLVLHQYEKTKQIMNCVDYEQRDQLERQVETLKKKIQIKTRQIEKVKKYQKNQKKINRNRENNSSSLELNNEILVSGKKRLNSTKSLPNKFNQCDQANSSMCSNHLKNLTLLKEIKHLKQTILT